MFFVFVALRTSFAIGGAILSRPKNFSIKLWLVARASNFVDQEVPAVDRPRPNRFDAGENWIRRESLLDDHMGTCRAGAISSVSRRCRSTFWPRLSETQAIMPRRPKRQRGPYSARLVVAGHAFAYQLGCSSPRRKHLDELGATEPKMPPLNESKFEPMPEVEINSSDDSYAGDPVRPADRGAVFRAG